MSIHVQLAMQSIDARKIENSKRLAPANVFHLKNKVGIVCTLRGIIRKIIRSLDK